MQRNSNLPRVEVLFTNEQLALIKAKAALYEMTIGEYVRYCVLSTNPGWRNIPDVPKRGQYERRQK